MTSQVILKKSAIAGKVPATSDLTYGELALNYADGKLYYKDASDVISSLISTGGSGGSGSVTSVSGTGTVSGISLSGTVTSSGNLTLGGTLDLSSPPAIGGTAAAAGTFTTLIGGSGSANYEQITGSATGKAVQFQSLGSDAAVSLAIQSKGTGAIDLAAGTNGVNISNGGTVTALTRTAAGTLYTSFPTWSASAPTTAGGVTASGSVGSASATGTATVVSGGAGYTNGDILTPTGGTGGSATRITVSAVSGGVITAASVTANSEYTVLPTNPVSVTGGTGSGATFNLTYSIGNIFNITTAGSGYVEQPTVTFSGGGGSGAAAYAAVGAGTIIRSLGSTMSLYTPAGEGFRVVDSGGSGNYWQAFGTIGSPDFRATASGSISATGANSLFFRTNSTVNQFVVAHTTSAVNYLQVTGAATGAAPVMSAQGSDAAIGLTFNTKSTGVHTFQTNGTTRLLINSGGTVQLGYANATPCFTVVGVASQVNGFQLAGSVAGSAPALSSTGTDADINLTLTPKGVGKVLTTSGIQINTNQVQDTVTLTTTSTTQQVLTAQDATIYRAVKFLIRAVDSTLGKYHSTEILAVHNGSTATSTEYASVNIGGICATFDVDYSASTIRLLCTPATANSTIFTVALQLLK